MKVVELIERLQEVDPALEVICCTEDNEFLIPGHRFRLFDIDRISIFEGKRIRGMDQIPSLDLNESPHVEKIAIIEITAEF